MKDKDRGVALELKNRLAGLVQLVDFCVFGSRARGDAMDDSDMDVFIEVENLDKDLKERVQDAAWEVGFENFMVISPLIFTRDELENSPLRSSPIVRVIKEEGLQI
jgi:predicted nucleotidyltransferase